MKRGFRKDTAEEGGMCGYEREREGANSRDEEK